MKPYFVFSLAFFASLPLAPIGFAQTTIVYSDSFDPPLNPGWTNISGLSHFTTVAEPGNPSNSVLDISTKSNDYYPPSQPQAQTFNTEGRRLAVGATTPWTVAVDFGVSASYFKSAIDMSSGLVTPNYDTSFSVKAGTHDIELKLANHVFSDQIGRLVYTVYVDGTATQYAETWGPEASQFFPQLDNYDPNVILWNTTDISADSDGNVSVFVEGLNITDPLGIDPLPSIGANPMLSSITLESTNHGDSFDAYYDNLNVWKNQGPTGSPGGSPVPEPGTYGLIAGLGLISLSLVRSRSKIVVPSTF